MCGGFADVDFYAADKQPRARCGHGRDDAPRPIHGTWTHEGLLLHPHESLRWSDGNLPLRGG